MSNRKMRSSATFSDAQLFPDSLAPLQRFWGGKRTVNFSLPNLNEIGKDLPGFRCMEATTREKTKDGYVWFWSPTFDTRDGKVMVAFPWCQDFDKRGGTSTDRHISIFTAGNPTAEEVDEIISKLLQTLTDYEKKRTQELKVEVPSSINEG